MDPDADKKTQKIGKGLPGPGRPKGAYNRTTRALKDAILMAAQEAGDGDMVRYLVKLAKQNPTAFAGLLGRVLPLTVAGDEDNPLALITTIRLVGRDD